MLDGSFTELALAIGHRQAGGKNNEAMTSKPSIMVEQLSKRYQMRNFGLWELWQRKRAGVVESNHFWALKDVSFRIMRGESWGVIGKNGSGKTTLLRVLSGVTYPTSGAVECNGKVAAMLSVGVGFNLELSGRENVYLNGSILGFSRHEIDERFDGIVEFSEISEFIDVPVKRYSSGMRVRLGFSVAAYLQPEIWLIDEVLAVGDVSFRQKALNHLRDISTQSGRTLLLVSHNMGAVQDFCENAIWLDGGRIRDMGDVETVVQRYLRSMSAERGHDPATGEDVRHEGTQRAILTAIDVLDRDGQSADTYLRGDPITFRIHYHSLETIDLPVFTLRVIGVENRVTVSKFHSIHDGLVIDQIQGDGFVEIHVPEIVWMPGRYRYIPSLESSEKEIFDLVRSRNHIQVLPDAQLSRTKYEFNQTHMAVYLPVSWTHNESVQGD